jgi:hypothetical protein
MLPAALRDDRATRHEPAASDDRGEPAPRRNRFGLVVVGGAVVAAVLGFLLGGAGGDDPSAAAPVDASAANLAVQVPGDWNRMATAPPIPGMTLEDPVAFAAPEGEEGAVVFGSVPEEADNSTLLPTSLIQAAGEVPSERDAVQLGPSGVQALRYQDVELSGLDQPVTLFAAPTTEGVATVACVAAADCDSVANSLENTSGEALPVGPSADYAEAVSGELATLSKAAAKGEKALGNAKTPSAQAKAARDLRGAYAKASRRVEGIETGPADRGANARLAAALDGVSKAYGRAASAASNNNNSGYRRAGRAVDTAQEELSGAIEGLRAAGYQIES